MSSMKTQAVGGEVGWAMLKGLAAAAVLIAFCFALAALRPAHAEADAMAGPAATAR